MANDMGKGNNIGFQTQRMERFRWLQEYLEVVGKDVTPEYDRVVATIIIRYGLTTEKAKEYLDTVILANNYEVSSGRIFKRAGKQGEL
jgi:hypothetical protein